MAAEAEEHGVLQVRCLNARFSPNLGDGLLALCLERRLVELGAGSTSVDLAARQGYGRGLPGRGALLSALGGLPGPLRRAAVRVPLAVLGQRRWRPHYRAHLAGADAVVIGGGNLLADLDLNFPTKLSLALHEATRLRLPVAIHACGMARGWSRPGLALLRRALAASDLRGVFLRDAASCDAWQELLAPWAGRPARLVRDPGLLASRYFPRPARAPGPPRAGIGITSAVAVRYHSDRAPAARQLDSWYLELALAFLAAGHEVHLFTNGSPEDREALARIAPRLMQTPAASRVRLLAPGDPGALCRVIGGLDVLVAFRLHAIIAAHSYGIPTVGLRWDAKLEAFLASVGRGRFLIDVTRNRPEEALHCAEAARTAGIPEAARQRVVDEAAADVAALARSLGLTSPETSPARHSAPVLAAPGARLPG